MAKQKKWCVACGEFLSSVCEQCVADLSATKSRLAARAAAEAMRERCAGAVCPYCAEGSVPREARGYDQKMHLFQGYPPRLCRAAAIRAMPVEADRG